MNSQSQINDGSYNLLESRKPTKQDSHVASRLKRSTQSGIVKLYELYNSLVNYFGVNDQNNSYVRADQGQVQNTLQRSGLLEEFVGSSAWDDSRLTNMQNSLSQQNDSAESSSQAAKLAMVEDAKDCQDENVDWQDCGAQGFEVQFGVGGEIKGDRIYGSCGDQIENGDADDDYWYDGSQRETNQLYQSAPNENSMSDERIHSSQGTQREVNKELVEKLEYEHFGEIWYTGFPGTFDLATIDNFDQRSTSALQFNSNSYGENSQIPTSAGVGSSNQVQENAQKSEYADETFNDEQQAIDSKVVKLNNIDWRLGNRFKKQIACQLERLSFNCWFEQSEQTPIEIVEIVQTVTHFEELWFYGSVFGKNKQEASNELQKVDVQQPNSTLQCTSNPLPIVGTSIPSQALNSNGGELLGSTPSYWVPSLQASSLREDEFRSRRNSFEYAGVQIIRFNDIDIDQPIGEGSRGWVYRGKYMSRQIVVKMMHQQGGQQAQQDFEEFIHEVEMMMKVSRFSCFVQICGVVLEPQLCIVMEEAKHGSLFNLLHGRQKDTQLGQELAQNLRTRLRIAFEVAIAMNILHNQNILHLDLKSQNILINGHDFRRGGLKVADFDLSRQTPVEYRTQGEQGTPQYMAHEVLSQGILSDKADIYSFGVVLHELVTKQIPWSHVGRGEHVFFMVAFNKAKLDLPTQVDGIEIDPLITNLISKCWKDEPNDRPSFKDISVELEQIISRMQQ